MTIVTMIGLTYFMSFRNDTRLSDTLISPVSIILSSKVSAGGTALKTSKVQSNEPITLTFGYSLVSYVCLFICTYVHLMWVLFMS